MQELIHLPMKTHLELDTESIQYLHYLYQQMILNKYNLDNIKLTIEKSTNAMAKDLSKPKESNHKNKSLNQESTQLTVSIQNQNDEMENLQDSSNKKKHPKHQKKNAYWFFKIKDYEKSLNGYKLILQESTNKTLASKHLDALTYALHKKVNKNYFSTNCFLI